MLRVTPWHLGAQEVEMNNSSDPTLLLSFWRHVERFPLSCSGLSLMFRPRLSEFSLPKAVNGDATHKTISFQVTSVVRCIRTASIAPSVPKTEARFGNPIPTVMFFNAMLVSVRSRTRSRVREAMQRREMSKPPIKGQRRRNTYEKSLAFEHQPFRSHRTGSVG